MLRPGAWQGPLESGYGSHLVLIDSVIAGRVPAFEEIEPDVKTARLGAQKAAAWQKAYEDMRARHKVLLPIQPEGATASANASASSCTDTLEQIGGPSP